MRKLFFIALLTIPRMLSASVIINPKPGSGSLTPGSTFYIQNTFTPSTTSQVFNVQQGQFDQPGFIMTDSAGCTWNATINTLGALVTTLIQCPSTPSFIPCTPGVPLGLLLVITCP